MLPALRGDDVEAAALYWEHIGNAAVRVGPWKLVRDHPDDWELYNIDEDRTELLDRAAEQPELVVELAQPWQTWADRVGVLDWDAERIELIEPNDCRKLWVPLCAIGGAGPAVLREPLPQPKVYRPLTGRRSGR